MKVLVIHCLPNETSFTRKLKNAFVAGLKENRHEIEELDLVQKKFDPLLEVGKPADDLEFFQKKIAEAEILVFAYPTWWFNMPAIMKGFFDRVFTSDFAFRYENGRAVGLLDKIKSAYLISSMGVSFWSEFFNINGARSFYANFKGIMNFCGIKKVHRIQAYGLTKNTANSLAQHFVSLARQIGQNIPK
jgi:NAD(P)H dehydrogenase (quinone)